MFKHRWDDLLAALRESGLKGIAIMPGPNMFYLTGLSMGLSERPTLLAITEDGKAFFVMPK